MSTKGHTHSRNGLPYLSQEITPAPDAGKRGRTYSPQAIGARSGRCTATKLPPCNNACGTNEKKFRAILTW